MCLRARPIRLAPIACLWSIGAAAQPAGVEAVDPPPPAPQAAADQAATETHADRVGWNQRHTVTENVYFEPGYGLTAESRDQLFKLQTRVRGQFRYEVEKPDDERATHTFLLRRVRVIFSGHWWGEDNAFKLELALSPRDLGLTPDQMEGGSDFEDQNPILDDRGLRVSRSPVLDMYLQFKQLRDLNVRIGQYKIPFNRQRVISSGDLMFVDRTIVNGEFTLDRDIGLDFRSENLFGLDDRLRYYVGIYTGEGHSSFYQRPISGIDHGFGLNLLARIEVLPFGTFASYQESDLERTPDPKLSVGGSIAHIGQARGNRGILGSAPSDGGTTDFLMGEADFIFKFRGLSAQSEFMMRRGRRNDDGDGTPLEAPRDGWGLTGQMAYLCSRNVEVGVRHSVIRGGANSSLEDSNETGAVVGWYLAGHPYKVQADFYRLYGDSIREGDYLFRTQLQLAL